MELTQQMFIPLAPSRNLSMILSLSLSFFVCFLSVNLSLWLFVGRASKEWRGLVRWLVIKFPKAFRSSYFSFLPSTCMIRFTRLYRMENSARLMPADSGSTNPTWNTFVTNLAERGGIWSKRRKKGNGNSCIFLTDALLPLVVRTKADGMFKAMKLRENVRENATSVLFFLSSNRLPGRIRKAYKFHTM